MVAVEGVEGQVQALLRDTAPARRAQLAHQVAHALQVQPVVVADGPPAAKLMKVSDFCLCQFELGGAAQLPHQLSQRSKSSRASLLPATLRR